MRISSRVPSTARWRNILPWSATLGDLDGPAVGDSVGIIAVVVARARREPLQGRRTLLKKRKSQVDTQDILFISSMLFTHDPLMYQVQTAIV